MIAALRPYGCFDIIWPQSRKKYVGKWNQPTLKRVAEYRKGLVDEERVSHKFRY